MLTPQAIDVIEMALRRVSEEWYAWQDEYKRIEAALAELKEVKAVMQYADYPLDEEAALRTERQGQQVNESGLLPCPHCGNTNIKVGRYTDESEYWQLYCEDCTIMMQTVNLSETEAIFRWNRRTAPPANPVGTQWTPLPNGVHQWSEQDGVKIEGRKLEAFVRPMETFHDSFGNPHQRLLGWESVEVILPEGYAICRLTQQEGNSNE